MNAEEQQEEQQNKPIITMPPPDMQFNLTPKGEAELAAREEEESRGERQEAEQQRRDAATKARLEAVEQAGRQARALLGSIGEKIGGGLEDSTAPAGDDISDLFEGPQPEDNDVYVKDLVTVSEEDVFGDGGEDMSDLLEVDDEDIMGEEEPENPPARRSVPRRPTITRRQPPSGLAGMR